MSRLRFSCFLSILFVFSSDACSDEGWRDELLLQLNELRSNQIKLNREVSILKDQLAKLQANKTTGNEEGVANRLFLNEKTALGSDQSNIAIIEISDFECPYCARHAREVFPILKAEFIDTGIARYDLMDYPLSFHPGAKNAAVAVRCAGEQGKYWDAYSKLFEDRGRTRNEHYKPVMDALNLDWESYIECYNDSKILTLVEDDIAQGKQLGIDGTPRFIFGIVERGQLTNIKMLKGARDIETFRQAIADMQRL